MLVPRHSLHWECGLKQALWEEHFDRKSLPSLGVWIETMTGEPSSLTEKVTPFIGSVD